LGGRKKHKSFLVTNGGTNFRREGGGIMTLFLCPEGIEHRLRVNSWQGVRNNTKKLLTRLLITKNEVVTSPRGKNTNDLGAGQPSRDCLTLLVVGI